MRFLSFSCLALILLVAACGPRTGGEGPLTRYELPSKPGGRVCSFQCRNAFEHCTDGCNLSERECYNEAQEQAIRDYEAYAREQFMSRAPNDLRPRDFEHNGHCVATICRKKCKQKYDKCFVECGGNIVNQTSCQSFWCF